MPDTVLQTLGAFDWADPFRLDDQLTEDERMIRDARARLRRGRAARRA